LRLLGVLGEREPPLGHFDEKRLMRRSASFLCQSNALGSVHAQLIQAGQVRFHFMAAFHVGCISVTGDARDVIAGLNAALSYVSDMRTVRPEGLTLPYHAALWPARFAFGGPSTPSQGAKHHGRSGRRRALRRNGTRPQRLRSMAAGFLKLDLVFAHAALFHLPSHELPRVLPELHASLKPGGVLFSSNRQAITRKAGTVDAAACIMIWKLGVANVSAARFLP
jgi:SAM-dependent methyltransferase